MKGNSIFRFAETGSNMLRQAANDGGYGNNGSNNTHMEGWSDKKEHIHHYIYKTIYGPYGSYTGYVECLYCENDKYWGYVIPTGGGYGYADWNGDGYADRYNPYDKYHMYGQYGKYGYGGKQEGYGSYGYGYGYGYDQGTTGSKEPVEFGAGKYQLKGFFSKDDFDFISKLEAKPSSVSSWATGIMKQSYDNGCGPTDLALIGNINTSRGFTENDGLFMMHQYFQATGREDVDVVEKMYLPLGEGGGFDYEDVVGCLEYNATRLGVNWENCLDAQGNYDPLTAVDNGELAILDTVVNKQGHAEVLVSYKFLDNIEFAGERMDMYEMTTINPNSGTQEVKNMVYTSQKRWGVLIKKQD